MSKKNFKGIVASVQKANQEIEITILEELKALIPPLTTEEYKQLETNIIAEGCKEPLQLWEHEGKTILVDGHNRYSICKKNNLTYKTNFKEFSNIDAVKDWMINNQLGRRNLTELQKSYLRGLQYKQEKKKVGENQYTSGVENITTPQKTAEKLAKQNKVSEKTIRNDEKFAEGINVLSEKNTEIKDAILSKEVSIPSKTIQEFAKLKKNETIVAEMRDAIKKKDSGKIKNLTEKLETKQKNKLTSLEEKNKLLIEEIKLLLSKTTTEKLVKIKELLEN